MILAPHRLALRIALIISGSLAAQAHAISLIIDNSVTTPPDTQDVTRITVTPTGSLITSSTALGLHPNYQAHDREIYNSGQIISTGSLAIDISHNPLWSMSRYYIQNNAGSLIQGEDAAIRITDHTASYALIENSGTIRSLNGEGLELRQAGWFLDGALAINRAGGLIHSTFNDGIKAGNQSSFLNYGEISTGDVRSASDEFDGIDIGTAQGALVDNRGLISGGRHGVVISQDGLVENRGTLTGRNGAGVFSDTDADVRNQLGGVITGGASGLLPDVDGDGVRVGKSVRLWNEGAIQGTGARGVNQYGKANTSEGISAGGGFIIFNSGFPRATGEPHSLISGANNGILIDDGNGGSAFSSIQVYNYGIIRGLDGFGVKFVGDFADEVENDGLISGTNGLALDMGGGDDTLRLRTKSRFEGLVDGGTGHNLLIMGNEQDYQYNSGSFGESRNFQALEVRQGYWTLTGKGDFNEGVHVFAFSRLNNLVGVTGAVLVDQGAQYSGSGTVGNLTINGTLHTSAELGGPRVNGDLTMGERSQWFFNVNADGSAGTTRVTGNASLTGSLLRVYPVDPPQLYPWHSQYTVLEAGSITGTFDPVIGYDYAFLSPILTYSSNRVDLTFTRNEVRFADYARTTNGVRAMESLDSSQWDSWDRTPIFGPGEPQLTPGNRLYQALLNTSESSAGIAIEKLAGSGNANLGIATLNASSQVATSMLAAMHQMGSGAGLLVGLDQAQTPPLAATGVPSSLRNLNDPNARGRVWLQGIGSYGKLDGEHGNPGLQQKTAGSVLGIDWSLSPVWRMGVLGGYSKTDLSNSDVDGKLRSWHLGVYAMRQDGPLALRLGAAYSQHDGDNKRTVEFDRFSDRPKGSYDADSQQAFAELGYTLGTGRLNVEPFANLGYQRYHRDRYTEKGGAASLDVYSQTQDNFSSTFGVRLAQLNQLQNGISLTPRASLGWRHTYGDVDSETRQAFVLGGSAFKVEGSALDRDSLMIEAGLDVGLSARHTLSVGYNGELGSNSRNHAWMGQWQMSF
ncbi:autotransporter outer membrane beta-barrel domain-containing protein [Pseudomonas chlororaphis]|uniref:autotransporter family protein n=1 Tax=Pseudomonas chlororaphis TaxID=587753 RepID=UPI000789E713|nr:autotransporter outer membrane beta-barrel domain-containing protein [Pseudomonas chlororaphis]AMS15208.1 autotransporter outer membrane beta-barrel domain-containing protein [Pseudomonas chlororaphis]